MGFAENLRHCMDARGQSAYRLAKNLGVNGQSVMNWLSKGMVPHQKTRQKIADYFGITLEALDGDALPVLPPEGEKNPPPRRATEREQLLSAIDRALFELTEEQKLEALRYIWGLQNKGGEE